MNQNTVTGGKSLAQKGLNPSSTTSTNPQGGTNPGGGGTSPTPPATPSPVGSISAPSSSVGGSIVLFNGTSGHSIKQSTGSGIVVETVGVVSDVTFPSSGIPISTGTSFSASITEADGHVVYGSGGAWGKTSAPSLTAISITGSATIGSSSGIAKLTSGGVSAITLTGVTTQYLDGSGAFSAPAGTTRASLGLDVTDTPAFLGIKNVQSLTTDLVIPTGYNAILVGTINSNGHMITGQGTALLRIL